MNSAKNILYLGPERESIRECLELRGDQVVQTEEDLRVHPELLPSVDLIVSYGYRHIIRPEVVRRFERRIINLHISMLPWNRGADPNVWSFLEDTPKGVSIHYIDPGIDTGDLLCQMKVPLQTSDTLRSSYEKLSSSIESLFVSHWSAMRNGEIESRPQIDGGSYHRKKDLDPYRHLLTNGWDTPVSALIGQALRDEGKIAHAV